MPLDSTLAPVTRSALLSEAETRLRQAGEVRIGYLLHRLLTEAANLLRRAGEDALADRLDDDDYGDDVPGVLGEVVRLRHG